MNPFPRRIRFILASKPRSILIAGCGYVGTSLGKSLKRLDDRVWGLCRSAASLEKVREAGLEPVQADLTQDHTLEHLPWADYVIACQAPSSSKDTHEKTYYQGTRYLLDALQNKKPKKFILISSTSVYGNRRGAWLDENTPLESSDPTLVKTEQMVLASKIPSVIFRLGGIYGPGRNRLKRILDGAYVPTFSDDYTNRIHRDDIVEGIQLLMEKGQAGEVYLGVDNEPVTHEVFYSWIYEKLSLAKPDSSSVKAAPPRGSKRCSNKKIKALGLQLKYPTYKEGYEELIKAISGKRLG